METTPNNNNINGIADSVEDKVEDVIEDDIEKNADNTIGERGDDKYEKLIQLYREELVSLKHTSNDLFEKQLSYISAGALGLSMIVVDKVFKDISNTTWKETLIISWICFGATLIINLVSHLYAGNMHNRNIADIDNDKYDQQLATRRNFQINVVNYISVIMLFIGICCFITYTSKNIYSMNNKKAKSTTTQNNTEKPISVTPKRNDTAGSSSTPPPPTPKQPTKK